MSGSSTPPKEQSSIGRLGARVWEVVKLVATASEQLRSLQTENARLQTQVIDATRMTIDLVKTVSEMVGKMDGIEKRLDDKDRMVEMMVRERVREEMAGSYRESQDVQNRLFRGEPKPPEKV